jgi:hypothetical protein
MTVEAAVYAADTSTLGEPSMSIANLPRLIDETEAANILGLSVKTLRRWRWGRNGPAFCKLGAAVRYNPADLDAFIAAGRRAA